MPVGMKVMLWLRDEMPGLARTTSGASTVPVLMISSPASTAPLPLPSAKTSQPGQVLSAAQGGGGGQRAGTVGGPQGPRPAPAGSHE